MNKTLDPVRVYMLIMVGAALSGVFFVTRVMAGPITDLRSLVMWTVIPAAGMFFTLCMAKIFEYFWDMAYPVKHIKLSSYALFSLGVAITLAFGYLTKVPVPLMAAFGFLGTLLGYTAYAVLLRKSLRRR